MERLKGADVATAVGVEESASTVSKQPVEIIGGEDITQQIAVQIETGGAEREVGRGVRDTVIEVSSNNGLLSSFLYHLAILKKITGG